MITLNYLTPSTINISGGRLSVLNSNAPAIHDQELAFPSADPFTKAIVLRVDPGTAVLTVASYPVTDTQILQNNLPSPPGSLVDICRFWSAGPARCAVAPLYTDVVASHNISFGNVAP